MNAPVTIIDGDMIVYQYCTVCETDVLLDGGVITLKSDFKEIQSLIAEYVTDVIDKMKGGTIFFVVTDSVQTLARREIYPDYKSNRKGRKPLGFGIIKEWLRERPWCVFTEQGMEGDDLCGILASHYVNEGWENVNIISDDKDFKTIPNVSIYPVSLAEPDRFSVCSANYHFLTQTLTGDRVDGYPGCPTVGPVNAARILSPVENDLHTKTGFKQGWDLVVQAYEKNGKTSEDALTQARLAFILREPYKVPNTWTPESFIDGLES